MVGVGVMVAVGVGIEPISGSQRQEIPKLSVGG